MSKIAEMRNQAYYDSRSSCQDNVNKYNYSDPILQQNDYYVSNKNFIFNYIQKPKEIKSHIERKNYYNKINLDNVKYERPKKAFIDRNDCLDKNFKDKSPIIPELPHKKQVLTEYEKKNHQEKIKRKPKTVNPQPDNVFNFNSFEKIKNKKKIPETAVPSKNYTKTENSKMAYNYYLNQKPQKGYDEKGQKDNLNDLFKRNLTTGNIYMERPHKKVNYKNTEVQKIFENGKNNIPIGYKEPTKKIGKDDFDEMAISALNNFDNIRKNGRKPLKKDF